MANKHSLKANFAVEKKYEAFYTGGKVQFTNDGTHMLCRCAEKVNLLEISSGTVKHTFGQEGDGEVSSFALSPDNKILVTALSNLLLKQWDFETKQLTRSWKAIHIAPVNTMTFDSTSTLLATGGSDSTIKVWDVIQQYCTHNLRGHQGVITSVAFHPLTERLQLVTAGEDYKLRVWNLRTSACLSILEGHYSVVTAIQFSTDAHSMFSGGRDKVVIMWNMKDFSKVRTIPVYETVESVILLDKTEERKALNITTSCPHFITGGSKGVLRVWNATTAQCVFTQQQEGGDTVKQEPPDGEASTAVITDAIHCPVTQSIAVITHDHNICLHNTSDLTTTKQFAGYNDEVLDIRLVGPGESHIAVVTNSPLVKVFELETWDVQILRGHTDIVLALDVYSSGLLFASSSKDNTIRLWQFDPGTKRVACVAAAYGHTHEILAIGFSKLSSGFLVSGSQDLTMKVWTVPSDLSPASLASLNARATEKAHDKDINSIVVSPNDKLIATGSQDKTAKLWRADGLKLLGVFRGHRRGIWCVQFSPVDQCLATASSDCTVKIWTLTDYTCVKTFEGHDALVLKVHFLTRGMQLITSGSDGLMKLWTIKTSECVKTLDEHTDRIWALTVNKAQDRLVSGGGDSTIIVWKDVTETEYEEQRNKQIEALLKEQQLSNLIQQKKYLKALALAITLEKPFRALSIIKDILGESEGQKDLERTLAKLRKDQLDAVLRFCVQWNTNSKHCHAAQVVVSTVIRTTTPEDLLALPNAKSALEGLLPYTEKHLQRMSRLLQQAMFVEYTWQTMRLVSGEPVESTMDKLLETEDTSERQQSDVLNQTSESSTSEDESVVPAKKRTKVSAICAPVESYSDSSDDGLSSKPKTSSRRRMSTTSSSTSEDETPPQNSKSSSRRKTMRKTRSRTQKRTEDSTQVIILSDKENQHGSLPDKVGSLEIDSNTGQRTPYQPSSKKLHKKLPDTDPVRKGRKLELKSAGKRKKRKSDLH